MEPAELAGARVGIPGLTTTAWLVLRLIQPAAIPVEIPIVPFARIFEALEAGEVDAALLIHEGRLLYGDRGLHKVVDLGEWWLAEAGLPLPLGVNVIRRGLGAERIRAVSAILRESIRFALDHRSDLIAALAAEDRGEKSCRTRASRPLPQPLREHRHAVLRRRRAPGDRRAVRTRPRRRPDRRGEVAARLGALAPVDRALRAAPAERGGGGDRQRPRTRAHRELQRRRRRGRDSPAGSAPP